ncbi:MAG: PKD domain-containing protein, partial [Gemmatimonadales bacterium]
EAVTLNGSGSTDAEGTIASYVWSEGGNTIATGVNPNVTLSVGVHTITLTVTDNGGATGTDAVTVTVQAGPTTLTILGSGTGDGTVTSTPAGISCTITNGVASGDCTEVYPQGTGVTLTGTASTVGIHEFGGWSGTGEACAGVGPCTITLDGDLTVTALFTQYYTLTVQGGGNGSGTVAGGNGIDCIITGGAAEGTCSTTFAEGVIAGLAATPGAGSDFTGWSGACTGTGACQVTMNQDQTVTATFSLQRFTVTVVGAGTGAGGVSSTPGGIECASLGGETSGTCSAAFEYGTSLTLDAAPAAGSEFTGWEASGASCPGTGTCSFVVTANQTVAATFDIQMATLTVLIDGLGEVVSQGASPPLSCSYVEGLCSVAYPWGTQVTLVASSLQPDFLWESWFGTGTGFTCTTNATCVVTMDQDREVRAWFSSPGILSASPTTAGFSMLQAGTPTPSSQTVTISNIGQRSVTIGAIQTSYGQQVAPWLNATIDRPVIDTLTPATLTLSIIPNNLDPMVYTATVAVGDFVLTVTQVNVTLTVQLPNPILSNVTGRLVTLNDPEICGYQDPDGSLFQFDMNYTDADGDVNQSTAVLTVAYQFIGGSSGQFQQPPEAGLTVGGDGFSGTITSYVCNVFGNATGVTEMFTLQDSQGNPSNTLSITVDRPGGANGLPADGQPPPPPDPTPSTAGGAKVGGSSPR